MKKLSTKLTLVSLSLLLTVSFTSCEATKNANNKQKGGVIGAGAGAILGAIIGNNIGKGGNGELGAIIGGVIGGGAGVLIGNKMDKQAEKIENEIPGAVVERVEDAIVITFDETSGVYFSTNKSNINIKSEETLTKLFGIFAEYPDTNIAVIGHTDSSGAEEYNLVLSKKRAESVTSFLISKGLPRLRFKTTWFGETQPKYDNNTEEGRAKNRRVNIAILPNDKMVEEAKKEAGEN